MCSDKTTDIPLSCTLSSTGTWQGRRMCLSTWPTPSPRPTKCTVQSPRHALRTSTSHKPQSTFVQFRSPAALGANQLTPWWSMAELQVNYRLWTGERQVMDGCLFFFFFLSSCFMCRWCVSIFYLWLISSNCFSYLVDVLLFLFIDVFLFFYLFIIILSYKRHN